MALQEETRRMNAKEKKRLADKKYREKNKVRIREKDREYYQNNRQRLCDYQKKYREEHPEKHSADTLAWSRTEKGKACMRAYGKTKAGKLANKRHKILRRYGITVEDYDRMFNEQNGCCAICGKHQIEFKATLAVDHNHKNHKTNQVRGLLCTLCNTQLCLVENEDRLAKSLAYLEKWRRISKVQERKLA